MSLLYCLCRTPRRGHHRGLGSCVQGAEKYKQEVSACAVESRKEMSEPVPEYRKGVSEYAVKSRKGVNAKCYEI